MARLVLVLLAIVAVIFAQDPDCNYSRQCFKNGETGCNGVGTFCAVGTWCDANTCKAQARIGQSCTASFECWDPEYSLACDGGTCKYASIYGPNEACSDTANFVNGGCIATLTCTSGRCTIPNPPTLYCNPGNYFNGTACLPRKSAGNNCTSNLECIPTLVCTSFATAVPRTCQEPFSRTAGQSCESRFDCAAGTGCDTTVSPPQCRAPTYTGDDCSTSTGVCDDFWETCSCKVKSSGRNFTDTGSAKCQRNEYLVNTKSRINDFLDTQECLAARTDCNDYWFASTFLTAQGPNQCIRTCAEGVFDEWDDDNGNFNTCAFGSSSGAGFAIPSMVVLVAVLVAYLM